MRIVVGGNVSFDQKFIDDLVKFIREAVDGHDVIVCKLPPKPVRTSSLLARLVRVFFFWR